MTIETNRLIGIFVVGFIESVIASISGIGGGGVLIPLYTIIGDIELKDAILLSIITIAGNSVVRGLYYFKAKHTLAKNRYLPNYDIVRLIVPFDANTSYIGLLLNQILPNIVIFIFIGLLLCILIYKTVQKVIALYKNKNIKDSIVIIIDNIEGELPVNNVNYDTNNDRNGESKKDITKNMLYTITSFGLVTFCTFIRKKYDEEGNFGWLIYLIQVFIVGLFGYMTCEHIKAQYILKKKDKFNFVEGDIDWSIKESFIKYITASSFVGIISTMLGIGGAMIMNPVMINLNVLPEVVVATSSITTFFSALISALQFIIAKGSIEWYYGVLFLIGCFASLTGLIILRFLKSNIRFIITCVMSLSMIVSFILLIVVNCIRFANEGIS